MSLEIEDENSVSTVVLEQPPLKETVIEEDGLFVLVQDQPSSSVIIYQQPECEVLIQSSEANSVVIECEPSETLIIDLGLSTGNEESVARTGWAQYVDNEYTSASPFEIDNGQFVTLPNNAGSKIETWLPVGATALYDPIAQKIVPVGVGDYNTITIRFKAVATASTTHLDFGIDIGGTQGVIFRDVKVFPRGAGVEHPFSISCPGFSLNTFVANGGTVKLGATGGDIMVYDIEFQIVRMHGT